jgi:16S rRNA processing protein RimM
MDGNPEDPPFVVVGHVTRPHGTKGEFFIWSLTDRPESTFVPGIRIRVADASGQEPDPLFPPLEVEEARPFRKGYLVRFLGVEDRTRGEILRGRYLLRSFEETEPLDEGELFYHQLLGLTVHTPDGSEVGRVLEVYDLRPVDLLEVSRGRDDSILIPFTREIVVEWDLEKGRLVVNPPEGLLDL